MIIIPIKNCYFIGNIPYFQTNPDGPGDLGMSWGPRLVLVLFVSARQEGQKAQEAQHTRQTSRAGPDLSRWGRKPKMVALSNKNAVCYEEFWWKNGGFESGPQGCFPSLVEISTTRGYHWYHLQTSSDSGVANLGEWDVHLCSICGLTSTGSETLIAESKNSCNFKLKAGRGGEAMNLELLQPVIFVDNWQSPWTNDPWRAMGWETRINGIYCLLLSLWK